MVLKRISPQLWSGLCRETDRHLPSASWMISPDLLPTQCPAHHLPAALSACLSPPLTESHRPPRPTSRRCTERQSHGSLPSSVGTHSWAQPWKPGGSQIPALPPTHPLTLSPPSMQGFSIPGHRDPPRSAYFAWNWGLEDWNWERLIYAVQALRDCHPPASPWSEFPSTLPPRPVDPSAPPWPLAPSSPT